MVTRLLFIGLVGLGCLGSTLRAADEPAAKTASTPDTKAAATEAKPTEPVLSPAEVKFNDLLAQRETLREQLEKLQLDYKTTPPAERKPLRAKFDELLRQQAPALEQQTEAAAVELLDATKGEHEKAADFLQSAVVRSMEQDRYERALDLANKIIAQKVRNPRLYDLAGKAAYHVDQFDVAKKDFDLAAQAGALDPEATQLAASLDTVTAKWQAESKLREAEASADDLPRVELVTTRGRVVVELFENEAPQTVANFVSLVEKGFYKGLGFHRVLSGFVAQGGDPKGDGTGGPGYHIPCECERENARAHFRGSLSMAHAGKDTGGSQFFITLVRTPSLDGKHTVFGRVVEGMDTVAQFQRRDPQSQGKLATPEKILEARVLRKRDHAYEPTKTPE